MKLKQHLEKNREAIVEIAAKHGAFNVRIFGSVARGEETENSRDTALPCPVVYMSIKWPSY